MPYRSIPDQESKWMPTIATWGNELVMGEETKEFHLSFANNLFRRIKDHLRYLEQAQGYYVACIMIAGKYLDDIPPMDSVRAQYLCNNVYSLDDLWSMEVDVCVWVSWDLRAIERDVFGIWFEE